MGYVVKNNARALLAGAVSVGATSISITAGKGGLFDVGANYTYVTLESATETETVKLTGRSGDTLTVLPTTKAWNIGDVIECRPCAEAMAEYTVAAQINGSTGKTTPVDADAFGLIDSAAGNALKNVTWANIKATLKAYFDAIYTRVLLGAWGGITAEIASAATIDLRSVTGSIARVTGVVPTTGWAIDAGQRVECIAVDAWPLTYDAIANPLPGSVSHTCNPGDIVIVSKDSSNELHVAVQKRNGAAVSSSGHGQCQLRLSSGNLQLLPTNGNKLMVNGVSCTVPDAGVTLAAPATSGTTYFIYATASAGVINALEASTTGHVPSVTAGNKGVEVKTGDDARTLVGMARTASSAWVDSASQRFVRSWFNDGGLAGTRNSSTNVTVGSSPWVEVSSTYFRTEFLAWAGETLSMGAHAACFDVATSLAYLTCTMDTTISAAGVPGLTHVSANLYNNVVARFVSPAFLTDGYHYLTLLGGVVGASSPYMYAGYTGLQYRIGAEK